MGHDLTVQESCRQKALTDRRFQREPTLVRESRPSPFGVVIRSARQALAGALTGKQRVRLGGIRALTGGTQPLGELDDDDGASRLTRRNCDLRP